MISKRKKKKERERTMHRSNIYRITSHANLHQDLENNRMISELKVFRVGEWQNVSWKRIPLGGDGHEDDLSDAQAKVNLMITSSPMPPSLSSSSTHLSLLRNAAQGPITIRSIQPTVSPLNVCLATFWTLPKHCPRNGPFK